MHSLKSRCFALLVGLILTLSSLALLINHFIYKFPGNNFFPEGAFLSGLLLVIIYLGLLCVFGKDSKFSKMGKELVYFFVMMATIAFATNAVQLTPFPVIDPFIIAIEAKMNINMASIVSWTSQHPRFQYVLAFIYDTLPYQMSLIPLVIIMLRRFDLLRDYYFLMLCTVLIGFLFYYFFPTTAPASHVISTLFSDNQIATGLKFQQIHNHIVPTTNEGGLIAMPSFHVIWALLCVYLVKEWLVACIVLGIINSLLVLSCVLLGWHYPLDVLGGIAVLMVSYSLMRLCRNRDLARIAISFREKGISSRSH